MQSPLPLLTLGVCLPLAFVSGDLPESCGGGLCTDSVGSSWGDWGRWSQCSRSCGGGLKYRIRECRNPPLQQGDADCPGSRSETQACRTELCDSDGAWGSWKEWSACTTTCGLGQQKRVRRCDSPAPRHGGNYCPGSSTETTTCDWHCPVDGMWSTWSDWSSCTATCDGGRQERSRECDNPRTQHGGRDCEGGANETLGCMTAPCPISGSWGKWTEWTPCSVSCASGEHQSQRQRSRVCDNPEPRNGGESCPGIGHQTQNCTVTICPFTNGSWSVWGAWESCSVTCGAGVKRRTRACDSPAPTGGGEECIGEDADTSACSIVDCPESNSEFSAGLAVGLGLGALTMVLAALIISVVVCTRGAHRMKRRRHSRNRLPRAGPDAIGHVQAIDQFSWHRSSQPNVYGPPPVGGATEQSDENVYEELPEENQIQEESTSSELRVMEQRPTSHYC